MYISGMIIYSIIYSIALSCFGFPCAAEELGRTHGGRPSAVADRQIAAVPDLPLPRPNSKRQWQSSRFLSKRLNSCKLHNGKLHPVCLNLEPIRTQTRAAGLSIKYGSGLMIFIEYASWEVMVQPKKHSCKRHSSIQ